jgi:indolepyruvate ferredoxin oxidoreductase beta subunit
MKFDIVFAGVGGQGVLSMAAIIGRAAITQGLHAKQSEIHGMAQRGGAVHAHLRLSSGAIASDLIPQGSADLVLSLEPVEGLRYAAWLAPAGTLVTSSVPFANISDYPPSEQLLAAIHLLPNAVVVDAEKLALEAGDVLAVNSVMAGAASWVLPLSVAELEAAITQTFRAKGDWTRDVNLRAFRAGREAGAPAAKVPA